MGRFFTTLQVAAKIGISRQTLYSWIESGLVDVPKAIRVGNASIRLWTQADVDVAKKAKGKLKRGPIPKRKSAGGKRKT